MVNQPSRSISCQKCGGVVECVAGQQYLKCGYCESLILNGEATVSVDRITPMGSPLHSIHWARTASQAGPPMLQTWA